MHPTIREGDLVIYKPFDPNKESLKKGYIVVLNNPLRNEELIVKRVSNKRSNAIELRGDNEQASSDSRQFGFINQTEIIGIVIKIFPVLK
tara:strand:+ start:802 stop:1071 length:270 start_codon:yes stop_codon:yes gene_type:complete